MSDVNLTAPDDAIVVEQPEVADTNVATEEQLATLKRQLDASKQREEAAAAHVSNADKRVSEVSNSLAEETARRLYAEEVATDNAVTAAQNDISSLEKDYAEALAQGKFDDASKINSRLSAAQIRRNDAERYKEGLTRTRADHAARAERQRAEPEQRQPTVQVSPKAKAWIDAHPRFTTDAGYRDAALGAHNIATRIKGLSADTDEYFDFIEEQLGERQNVEAEPPQERRRAASSAAPPSRSVAAPAGGRQTRVTLSAQEREFADMTMATRYPDPAQRYAAYARNKAVMERDKPLTPVS